MNMNDHHPYNNLLIYQFQFCENSKNRLIMNNNDKKKITINVEETVHIIQNKRERMTKNVPFDLSKIQPAASQTVEDHLYHDSLAFLKMIGRILNIFYSSPIHRRVIEQHLLIQSIL